MQLPVQANLAASKLVAAGGIRKEGCGKSSSSTRKVRLRVEETSQKVK